MLLVEDDSGDAALIRQSLMEHGVGLNVVVLNDGEKAVQFVDKLNTGATPCPVLVVLDINLPRKSGLEVLQRIRECPVCASVPVVIFSSSDAARDKQQAASLGANRYIKKPLNIDEFMQVGMLFKQFIVEPIE